MFHRMETKQTSGCMQRVKNVSKHKTTNEQSAPEENLIGNFGRTFMDHVQSSFNLKL